MTNTAQTIDDFNIGEELCRFLIDGDFISESRATTLIFVAYLVIS